MHHKPPLIPGLYGLRRRVVYVTLYELIAIAMLTADGTRPSARAAAEKEPWSSTARNRCTLSEEKAMPALCAARTQILCQLVKKTDTS